MAMAYETKTKPTQVSVEAFIAGVEHPVRRQDAETLHALMAAVTGEPAKMWGPTIIGYGSHRYRYDSGHEGEICRMGFSPRKASLVLYLPHPPNRDEILARLGKHSTGKGCLYINKLADVDAGVLETLIRTSWNDGKTMG
jgi:hypothetical protein